MSWNPFSRLSSGSKKSVISRTAERELEKEVKKLEELDDVSRRLYKDAKRWTEANSALIKAERKITQDLLATALCQSHDMLKHSVEDWDHALSRLELQMHELNMTAQKTVIEPTKKFNSIFPHVQAALKKRDQSLQEFRKCQAKVDKYQDRDRTGHNIIKLDTSKKSLESAKEDFTSQNTALSEDVPKLYESRIEYFQPSLEALVNSQMTYNTEAYKQYSEVSSQLNDMKEFTKQQYSARVEHTLNELKSLSITVDD